MLASDSSLLSLIPEMINSEVSLQMDDLITSSEATDTALPFLITLSEVLLMPAQREE